jgi:hypothetical protein
MMLGFPPSCALAMPSSWRSRRRSVSNCEALDTGQFREAARQSETLRAILLRHEQVVFAQAQHHCPQRPGRRGISRSPHATGG